MESTEWDTGLQTPQSLAVLQESLPILFPLSGFLLSEKLSV